MGNVKNGFRGPHGRRGVHRGDAALRLGVGRQIREMHVVVAARQQDVANRCEDAGLVAVEVIAEDQIEGVPSVGLVLVVPPRAVPTAALGDLFGRQAEEEEIVFALSLAKTR